MRIRLYVGILFAFAGLLLVGCDEKKTSYVPFALSQASTGSGSTGSGSSGSGGAQPSPTPVLGTLRAGASRVDATPPIGVPLAGYGGGDRRLTIPDINPFNDYTFLKPSDGVLDPIYAKALVLDTPAERVAVVTIDAIAADGGVVQQAHDEAVQRGFSIPLDKVMVCASHTHSGPGAMSDKKFWQLTAADRLVKRVRDRFAGKLADALVRAEQNLQKAELGVGVGHLSGVTKNRRAGDSPQLQRDDIDDQLGVIRVDATDGTPIATVWNYAIHGTAYSTSNHKYSADIMGAVSSRIEKLVGGVALFVNGAEADIAPAHGGASGIASLAPIMADAVDTLRKQLATRDKIELETAAEWVDFGDPTIDASLKRAGVTSGGPFDIFGFLNRHGVNLSVGFAMDPTWVESRVRFQAIRIDRTLLSSIPGEPISLLGYDVRADGRGMGFDQVFICGLANNYMSYIVTETEYPFGGYEALGTFFGQKTGTKVQKACKRVADRIKP